MRDYNEGFFKSQADSLGRRWKGQPHAMQWAKIYRILFSLAEDDDTPSPYFDLPERLDRADFLTILLQQLEDCISPQVMQRHQVVAEGILQERRASRYRVAAQHANNATSATVPQARAADTRLNAFRPSTAVPVNQVRVGANPNTSLIPASATLQQLDMEMGGVATHNVPNAQFPSFARQVYIPGDTSYNTTDVARNPRYYHTQVAHHGLLGDSGYGSGSVQRSVGAYSCDPSHDELHELYQPFDASLLQPPNTARHQQSYQSNSLGLQQQFEPSLMNDDLPVEHYNETTPEFRWPGSNNAR